MDEQISQTRGDIYASIIHDINGPLTVISGFIQLMNQRIANSKRLELEDLEFIKDRLKTITRQVTNCIEISRRYLSFLRRQSDEAPRVGISQILADLAHMVRVHPSLHNNQFIVHPLAQDVAVRMNGTDVLQVLLNLAVNGFQCSSQPHSVEIRGRVLSQPLDTAALKESPQELVLNVEHLSNTPPVLMLAVSDTGP